MHYNRWITKGDPLAFGSRIVFDDATRFWSKVNKSGPVSDHRPDGGNCWLWTGNTVKGYYEGTYGIFVLSRPKRNVMAHRWAYEQSVGPIPEGLQTDHLCRVTLCVRPDHLEPVTQAENIRRENIARGRLSPTCREPGCSDKNRCFGMCNAHYLRWKKAGRPALT